jgi:putative transcriptional regulator
MILKNRIRELRDQYGYTQQELADKVNVSRQTVISLESGKYNPSIFLAYKIAKEFHTTIEELFEFEEEIE